jgi:hypothetical protein
MRQQVKITGFDISKFDTALIKIGQALDRLQEHIQPKTIQAVEFLPHKGHHAIKAHARYFTDCAVVPYDKNILFGCAVDPLNILGDIQPPQFIHATDNHVEYCRRTVKEDGSKR